MTQANYHQEHGDTILGLTVRDVPESRADRQKARKVFDLIDEWGYPVVTDVVEGEKIGQFTRIAEPAADDAGTKKK